MAGKRTYIRELQQSCEVNLAKLTRTVTKYLLGLYLTALDRNAVVFLME